MKKCPPNPRTLLAAALGVAAFLGLTHIAPADDIAAKPYKILATTQIPAAGALDPGECPPQYVEDRSNSDVRQGA